LADGIYRLTQTFALTAADSGQNGHTIIYRAAAGAKPVLSGAIAVTGFTQNGNIWSADVPMGSASRQLYVNGRHATRARGPQNPAGFTHNSTGFALGTAAMVNWPDRNGIEVVGTDAWRMYRCPVTSVASGGITVANPCWTQSQGQYGFS